MDYDSPEDTDNTIENNPINNTTVSPYSFHRCRGSAKRIKFSKHIKPLHSITNSSNPTPHCIIDSGATHHMWNNVTAFVSFCPEENGGYVKVANDQKIPIIGYGTICFEINNYTIKLEDVFYTPSLWDSLFSVHQHCRCTNCSFICNNDGCHLHFPRFTIPVPDDDEMVVKIKSLGTTINKIHWSNIPHSVADNAKTTPIFYPLIHVPVINLTLPNLIIDASPIMSYTNISGSNNSPI